MQEHAAASGHAVDPQQTDGPQCTECVAICDLLRAHEG